MRSRFLLPALVAGFALALSATAARADVLLQTATLGPAGQNSGFSISDLQYPAVRFQTAQTFTLTSVQIYAGRSVGGNGLLFAAIVPLTDLSDFPDGGNPALITDDNPVEVHTFAPTNPSSVSTIAFSSVLPAGTYGLVFGSGEFGATGEGYAANSNPNIGAPSYFRKVPFTNAWSNGTISNVYFVVNGTPGAVSGPEPGTLALLALGTVAGIAVIRRRKA